MKVITYARVSTDKQDLDIQREKLKAECIYKNYTIYQAFEDVGSGKSIVRKDFDRMWQYIVKFHKDIDALIIWKLDRIGRSLKDLIYISEELELKGIDLISISDNINTTTKEGRLFFHLLGAIAQYERELIIERTKLGIERAKKNGKICHRPRIELPMDEILRLRELGVPLTKIAERFNVSDVTIWKRLKEIEA